MTENVSRTVCVQSYNGLYIETFRKSYADSCLQNFNIFLQMSVDVVSNKMKISAVLNLTIQIHPRGSSLSIMDRN